MTVSGKQTFWKFFQESNFRETGKPKVDYCGLKLLREKAIMMVSPRVLLQY